MNARFWRVDTPQRSTLHRRDCAAIRLRHHLNGEAIPWFWANDKPLGEVRDALVEEGIRECHACQPFSVQYDRNGS